MSKLSGLSFLGNRTHVINHNFYRDLLQTIMYKADFSTFCAKLPEQMVSSATSSLQTRYTCTNRLFGPMPKEEKTFVTCIKYILKKLYQINSPQYVPCLLINLCM